MLLMPALSKLLLVFWTIYCRNCCRAVTKELSNGFRSAWVASSNLTAVSTESVVAISHFGFLPSWQVLQDIFSYFAQAAKEIWARCVGGQNNEQCTMEVWLLDIRIIFYNHTTLNKIAMFHQKDRTTVDSSFGSNAHDLPL